MRWISDDDSWLSDADNWVFWTGIDLPTIQVAAGLLPISMGLYIPVPLSVLTTTPGLLPIVVWVAPKIRHIRRVEIEIEL